MAIGYPTTIDAFTDITCSTVTDPKDVVNDLQDAIEALEAKVGATSSAVTTSHDYKLSGVTGTDKAMSLTGTETGTNKRFDSVKLNENVALTSTSTELNKLAGNAVTSADLTKLSQVTSTAAELNILDGVTATASELNILDGVTATATELNVLDGVTATTAEINYTDGVTSAIQTQLDNKWWEELGSTSNSGSAAIAVNSFAARKYLKIILTYSPSTGAQVGFQFNGDTGNNYGFTFNNPFGGAFSASVTASSTNRLAVSDTGGINQIGEFNVINIASKQKGLNGQMGGGTSTAIAGRLSIGAWNNTADQITSVNLFIASGNLGDAEMTILGHN